MIDQRISAFSRLGQRIVAVLEGGAETKNETFLADLIEKHYADNSWFTPEFIRTSLAGIAQWLDADKLKDWFSDYAVEEQGKMKRVGVITAGNIPLVGFHDFLSVIMSGNIFVGKLSSKNNKLLPALINMLLEIEPELKQQMIIQEDFLKEIDAVIATGSNNSSRYFEYYFGKYPHIIRKNRSSIAVLNGNESEGELEKLGDDIFTYFGLGCRSVSKLYIPVGFDVSRITVAMKKWSHLGNHSPFANNYTYQRVIYLMNGNVHADEEFYLIKEDEALISPLSVIFYEFYENVEVLKQKIGLMKDQLQCVVGKEEGMIPFGQAQNPDLADYADGVDTMKFLTENI